MEVRADARVTEINEEGVGLQINSTASSHPVSPTRLLVPPLPHPSSPRSRAPGASPWQPDRVPNT